MTAHPEEPRAHYQLVDVEQYQLVAHGHAKDARDAKHVQSKISKGWVTSDAQQKAMQLLKAFNT